MTRSACEDAELDPRRFARARFARGARALAMELAGDMLT
jgi:hypothetical protein